MRMMKSISPATLELIGEVEETDPNLIPEIIARSRVAQQQWAQVSITLRRSLLKKLLKYCSKNVDDIAKIIHLETGKPKIEAYSCDIFGGISIIPYSRDVLKKVTKPRKVKLTGLKVPMMLMGRSSYILPKPLGVIGIISPWNFPFGIPFSEIVMAIAVGNSVILKPSSSTVLTGLKIKELFDKAGFPKDIVQVIPGEGGLVGNALASSEVDRIIFTGSVAIGREIVKMSAQHFTPVTLELGCKSPMIVFNDVDIPRAVMGAVWCSFVNAGQCCAGVKRIYVQEDIYDEFLKRFKEKVEVIKQGHSWEDNTIEIGPVINKSALEKMEKYVQRALEQGAKILTGGKRNPNFKGYFFEPTVIYDAKQSDDVARDEIFGPIVVVLKFSSEEEATKLANDTTFGLFGSVWTKNIKKGKHVAEQLTMGTGAVNNHLYTYGLPQVPWGGNKDSGYGRTHGLLGFQELVDIHHVHVDRGRYKRDPWWFPYDEQRLKGIRALMTFLFFKKYRKSFSVIKAVRK